MDISSSRRVRVSPATARISMSALRITLDVPITARTRLAVLSAPVLRECNYPTGTICPNGKKCSMFYTFSDGKTCQDIDECLLDNGLCQQICINKVSL